MRRLLFILLLCITTSASGQFFAPNQKPCLGLQVNGGHPQSKGFAVLCLFNENSGGQVFDLSGNGNDGTLVTSDWVSGKFGSAVYMTVNDEIAFSKNAYDMGIRRHATFILYFRVHDLSESRYTFSDYDTLSGFGIRINNATTAEFFVYPNNHRVTATATFAVETDYMLAGVMDGANMYMYLDGKQIGTAVLGEDIGDSPSPISIGQRGDGIGNSDHTVDAGYIYNRALSASEIAQLYSNPFCFMQPSWNWTMFVPFLAVPAVGGQVIFINQ